MKGKKYIEVLSFYGKYGLIEHLLFLYYISSEEVSTKKSVSSKTKDEDSTTKDNDTTDLEVIFSGRVPALDP